MSNDRVFVTVEAAAELANVDIRKIRQWTSDGVLASERRGDMEAVHLDDVKALASASRRETTTRLSRTSLRALLREATTAETADHVISLQELVRQRSKA